MELTTHIIPWVVVCIVLFFGRHIIGGFFGLYKVIPVNEAHIRIYKNKKDLFSSRTGESSYWKIPYMTKIHRLPLCNLAIPVNDIKLNDMHMAKFVCDIMCFINIKDLNLAVERLTLTDASIGMGFDFAKLSEDLRAIMESIGRTVTTKQSILDIYMNRSMLDKAITTEVEAVFPKWGIELVDLELKDIKDARGSTIIEDIERKIAAEIRRDAEIKVATTTKEAELVKAEAEETYRKRQIEKDKQIGMAEQLKAQEIATQEGLANVTKVEASRKMKVGEANVEKERIEQLAQAKKIQQSTEAEGLGNQITTVGLAEAGIIQKKKEAEAAGTLKLAEALKAFDQTAINVKLLDIQRDIMLGKFNALAGALGKAQLKLILSGQNAGKFFGINLDAEGGANLEQFLQESGLDLDILIKTLNNTRAKLCDKQSKQ